jgi:subtilisin family serine protease
MCLLPGYIFSWAKEIVMQGHSRLHVWLVSVMTSVLFMGCATTEEDFTDDFGSTVAPLIGDTANAIPNEYIIVFRPHMNRKDVATALQGLRLRDPVSRVHREYGLIPAFAATLGKADLDMLRRNPDISYIERNQSIQLDNLPEVQKVEHVSTDGLDRIDQRLLPRDGQYDDRGLNGAGVHIYVIDSGIRATHAEFVGRIGNGYDFIDNDANPIDCLGHGTHVASSAAGVQHGVADGATIHAVRVFNCSGGGATTAIIIAAVDFVAQNCGTQAGRCVANMSLGGPVSTAMNSAVANAITAGIPFAVAAGNTRQGQPGPDDACTRSPASEPRGITVAAVDDIDRRANFSNFGTCVDIFGPGDSILGAGIASDTDARSDSGTSMASPHVAGVIAQILQAYPNATPADVEGLLESAATTGVVTNLNGSPNLLLFNGFPQPPQPADPFPAWMVPVIDLILE